MEDEKNVGEVGSGRPLLPDDFDQRAFASSAIPLSVEDLFPRAEIEFAFGDGDNDFAAHHLPFEVSIGVILTGVVVTVLAGGFVGGELFKPIFVVRCAARPLTHHR